MKVNGTQYRAVWWADSAVRYIDQRLLPHRFEAATASTTREVADAIWTDKPDLKVLYTSGYAENAIVHQGRLDEGVELLIKPYAQDVLLRRVRFVLDDLGQNQQDRGHS